MKPGPRELELRAMREQTRARARMGRAVFEKIARIAAAPKPAKKPKPKKTKRRTKRRKTDDRYHDED